MKGVLKPLLALTVIAAVALPTRLVMQAGAIGAGYAAKQICSGVFVAGLPEHFVVNTDVLPRLATVGPLARLINYDLDTDGQQVKAHMLGLR